MMLWSSSQALAFEMGTVGPGGVIPEIQQLRPLYIAWQLAAPFLEQTTWRQAFGTLCHQITDGSWTAEPCISACRPESEMYTSV